MQLPLKLREDTRALLERCTLFARLPEEACQQLLAHAHLKSFKRGQPIFRMGDPGDSMLALLSGEARISVVSPEGRQITLARLGPGEILGEVAVFDGRERTADATAVEDSTFIQLSRRDIIPVLERYPAALIEIVRTLCGRLRETDQNLAEIALRPMPSRLATALLRMIGDSSETPPKVKMSQRELGNVVGASRETVNKCLAEWQRKNVIRIEGASIAVLDTDALEDLTGE